MNILRAALGVLGLGFLLIVLWAAFSGADLHGGFLQQAQVLTTLPWGVATLFDLYLGFALFAVIVLLVEQSFVRAALWAAPIFVLGNMWSVIWLVLRLPYIADRLARRPPPAT